MSAVAEGATVAEGASVVGAFGGRTEATLVDVGGLLAGEVAAGRIGSVGGVSPGADGTELACAEPGAPSTDDAGVRLRSVAEVGRGDDDVAAGPVFEP